MSRSVCVAALIGLGLVGAACSNPAAPSTLVNLVQGPNWVVITGSNSSPPCSPLSPGASTQVRARVTFEPGASEWIGKTTGPGETLEIRIRTAATTIYGTEITGTMTGRAVDAWDSPLDPPTGVSMLISGPSNGSATLTGIVPPVSTGFAYGEATGTATFTDGTGASSSCVDISWTINPVR
jgi:hypothetical protein